MVTVEDLCSHLRNWFIRGTDMLSGAFTISGGTFTPPLQIENGRYFRIIGSVFNDGVYKKTDSLTLTDEEFTGAVWLMRVPADVESLLAAINEWDDKYGDTDSSPYQSESFGNYSYTKKSDWNSSAGGGDNRSGWQRAFSSKLDKWRKL